MAFSDNKIQLHDLAKYILNPREAKLSTPMQQGMRDNIESKGRKLIVSSKFDFGIWSIYKLTYGYANTCPPKNSHF